MDKWLKVHILIFAFLISFPIILSNANTVEVNNNIINYTIKEVEKSSSQLTLIESLYKFDSISIYEFKQLIAYKESRGVKDPYKAINSYGMLGKYQFSKTTLRILGYPADSIKIFLTSISIQENAMNKLVEANFKYYLNNCLYDYVGKEINGQIVTVSGILAACHLLGPASVRDYLCTNGSMREYYIYLKSGKKIKIRKRDANGTSIKEYLSILDFRTGTHL